MVQRKEGADAMRQQAIHQFVVKTQTLLVGRARAGGQQARPGEGKAVVLYPEARHQRDIFPEAVIMVAGGFPRVTPVYRAGR